MAIGDDINQQFDRVTDILRQQAAPQQQPNIPINILEAIAASSSGGRGNIAQNVLQYGNQQQDRALAREQGILQAFEQRKAMGDAQAKALDERIKMYTGGDTAGEEMFLQGLHDDPEEIDPSNSFQVMTKLAAIQKRNGYKSPMIAAKDEEMRLKNEKTKADIGATNALADFRETRTQSAAAPSANGASAGSAPEKPAKPLPVGALRMQQDALDAIGVANTIDADLGQVIKSIDKQSLMLGPAKNFINEGRNAIGKSTEKSRNFASFKATLEKMRNDSLRLNKGVQTEGDAVRAWNEILANINDDKLVKQRLAEVREINKRGADLQKLGVNQIRSNYGYEPLDFEQFSTGPAILRDAGGKSAPAPVTLHKSGWSIERVQ